MEKSPKKTGGAVRESQELEQLSGAAGRLCRVLSLIANDETQFYQREKGSRAAKQDETDPEQPRQMDIKALKDMVESLKSLTKIVRDLQELPDQPERHSQEIAQAKLDLAREQIREEGGNSTIVMEGEVNDLAK